MVIGAYPYRDAILRPLLVRAAAALACLLFLGLFAGCPHGGAKTRAGRIAHAEPAEIAIR